MRFISVAAVCMLAASSSVSAVPLARGDEYLSRRASTPAPAATDDESGALSLGKVATGLSIGSAVLPFVEGIFGSLFGGNSSSKRDLEELEALLKREGFVVARQDAGAAGADQSGALNILGIGSDIISILSGLLGGSSSQRRDEFWLTRAVAEEESGALKLPNLEQLANGASIASSAAGIIKDVFGFFGNNTRRDEIVTMLQARDAANSTSGALDLSGLLSGIVADLPDLLGALLKRDDASTNSTSGALDLSSLLQGVLQDLPGLLGDLLKRSDVDLLAARNEVAARGIIQDIEQILQKFPKRDETVGQRIADAIHRGVLGAVGNQKRDDAASEGIVARSLGSELQGATITGGLTHVSREDLAARSLGSELKGVTSGVERIFREKRGIFDEIEQAIQKLLVRDLSDEALNARAVKTSTASSTSSKIGLGDIANGASIVNAGLSILHDLFGGSSNSTAKRELAEYILRRASVAAEAADVAEDASKALSLGGIGKTLGNLGSLVFSGLGILGDLLPSNSTARRDTSKLGHLAAGGSVALLP